MEARAWFEDWPGCGCAQAATSQVLTLAYRVGVCNESEVVGGASRLERGGLRFRRCGGGRRRVRGRG
jgi:hypothetical protein